jgi:hypothetical protein
MNKGTPGHNAAAGSFQKNDDNHDELGNQPDHRDTGSVCSGTFGPHQGIGNGCPCHVNSRHNDSGIGPHSEGCHDSRKTENSGGHTPQCTGCPNQMSTESTDHEGGSNGDNFSTRHVDNHSGQKGTIHGSMSESSCPGSGTPETQGFGPGNGPDQIHHGSNGHQADRGDQNYKQFDRKEKQPGNHQPRDNDQQNYNTHKGSLEQLNSDQVYLLVVEP